MCVSGETLRQAAGSCWLLLLLLSRRPAVASVPREWSERGETGQELVVKGRNAADESAYTESLRALPNRTSKLERNSCFDYQIYGI